MSIHYLSFLLLLLTPLILATTPEAIDGFNIIWSDDFSGTELDSDNWTIWTGINSNAEEESYTNSPSNCHVSDADTFIITPQVNNGQWTSCRIQTTPSFSAPAGGKIIVQSRLKLGTAGSQLQGIWPAFWSLGQAMREGTSWPECGEIDTMENINGGSLGYGTLHCGTQCNDDTGLSAGTAFDYGEYHTWAHAIDLSNGDWTQQTITWYMDGQAYHVISGSDIGDEGVWGNVAHKAMYMTLNVAIGGDWPGAPAADTASGSDAGME
ncbi:Glucan endo-1,3-beta-glucosidase A1, partial [Lachnellula suecica]